MDKRQYLNNVMGGELTYEKSRELATANNLSRHEKIGFPNKYREGYANRAENTYYYVAAIDLTTPYGVPVYGEAGNGR